MITTRTRILSILAVVAMLVSMLACFVIPASANSTDPGMKEVLLDIVDYKKTDLYLNGWKKNETREDLMKRATTEVGTLIAGGATGYTWEEFDPDPENEDGNRYPLFRYHEEYEAAGYDGLNWSISGLEDWKAMDLVAIGPADPEVETDSTTGDTIIRKIDYVDADGNYFDNVTFHLTADVNFAQDNAGEGEEAAVEYTDYMFPLGTNEDDSPRFFSGTINGHKKSFQKVYIRTIKPANTGGRTDTSVNYSGLVYYLGDCEFIDFGIESGSIAIGSSDQYGNLSSFGSVYLDKTAEFNHVWVGATLRAVAGSITSALAGFYSKSGVSPTATIKVNGFVFDGEFVGKTSTSTARNAFYGVAGGNRGTFSAASTYSNIISYPTISKNSYTYLFGGTEDGMVGTASNVYGYLKAGENSTENGLKAGVGLAYDYRDTIAPINTTTEANVSGKNSTPSFLTTMTDLAAAHDSNTKQAGAEKLVYFTLDGGKIRPYGTAANKIIKKTINGGEPEYVNNGDVLTKTALATKLDIHEASIIGVTVNGGSVTLPYTLTDDAVIEVTASSVTGLATVWGKYSGMAETYQTHLTADAATAWEGLKAAVLDVEEETDATAKETAADNLLKNIETYTNRLATYEQYDETVTNKQIPGYALVDTYGEVNKNNVWAIGTTDDWKKMVVDSKYTGNGTVDPDNIFKPFEGYTFHVLRNIDFEKVTDLKPLCFGADGLNNKVPGAFRGTIEGHGHGFQNVNITVDYPDNSGGARVVGLIGMLSGVAKINDFGVDNGTIEVTGDISTAYVTTFGDAVHTEDATANKAYYGVNGSVAELNNVWSGMNLIANSDGSNYAMGFVATAGGSKIKVNGGYFYGTLNGNGNYGIFDRLRAGESFTNILIAPKPGEGKTITANYLLNEDEDSPPSFTLINNFVVGDVPLYDETITKGTTTEKNNGTATEDKIGAYNINIAQTADDGVEKVYFTWTKDGNDKDAIRPTKVSTNRIVKYTIIETKQGTETTTATTDEYYNAGTAVDVEELLPDGATDIVVSKLVEGTLTPIEPDGENKYPIESDVTVTYNITSAAADLDAVKTAIADKMADLEPLFAGDSESPDEVLAHFKGADELKADEIGLADWLALVDDETNTTDLQTAKGYLDSGKLVDEITAKDANYAKSPEFKYYDKYKDYQPEGDANWLIADKTDWYDMDETVSDTTSGNYFENTTFHLVEDVDFEKDEMWPLGAWDGNYFAGTIDGHGFGFKNVFVMIRVEKMKEPDTDHPEYTGERAGKYNGNAGLIGYLGDCTIKDFGINSGVIQLGTAGGSNNVSSFGSVVENDGTATPDFIHVWSGVELIGYSNSHISALAGADGYTTGPINVNGFTFYGKMTQGSGARRMAYGVYGANRTAPADGSTFANIISAPKSISDGLPSALFGISSAAVFAGKTFTNVYGIGIDYDYRAFGEGEGNAYIDLQNETARVYPTTNTLMFEGTAEAAAHYHNVNNTAVTEPVYFTLGDDGGIRPTADADKQLVEVTFTVNQEGKEAVTKVIYINANQAYTNDQLREALGYKLAVSITEVTVADEQIADYNSTKKELTVTDDAAITITIHVCNHKNEAGDETIEYKWDGTTKHTATCITCSTTATKSCTRNWKLGEVDANNGVYTHTATCPDCDHLYEQPCQGTLTQNTNCKENDYYTFTCDYVTHESTVEKPDSAEKSHKLGDWATDDVDSTKESRKCTNDSCEYKEYRIHGVITAEKIELKARKDGDSGDVTLTLPTELATADLTFAVTDGYTITHVNSTEWTAGSTFEATSNADVTVTIKAELTADGGSLTVTAENAETSDDTMIVIPATQVEIAFVTEAGNVNGDANDDGTGKVNLGDALAALYNSVEKDNAPVINLKNANLYQPETVATAGKDITIEDIRAIVVIWLEKALADS